MPTTYHLDSHSDLQEVYDDLSEDIAATDYQDWMASELVRMADLHRTFFQNQTSPNGTAWPKNALSTIRRKGHSRILRGIPTNNFRLSRSLTERVTSTTGDAIRNAIQTDNAAYMSFGTSVEYSEIHDRGTSRIPIRQHVGLNDEHINGMVDRLADEITKQLAE
jgi:phage gpG-like protein